MTSGATRRVCDPACELRLLPENSFDGHGGGTAEVSCEAAGGQDSGLATCESGLATCDGLRKSTVGEFPTTWLALRSILCMSVPELACLQCWHTQT